MRTRPWWFYKQSGVIPYRMTETGLEVLLITSRRRSRWIIPKGVVDLESTARESAGKEAYEEAGLLGDISPAPVGEYEYKKWGGMCAVIVYLLEVRTVLEKWPEAETRARRWLTVAEAAGLVEEPQLRKLILAVRDILRREQISLVPATR
jgi:8-oxo-dGTP pyrophosphatase MutT (NUDIX family)